MRSLFRNPLPLSRITASPRVTLPFARRRSFSRTLAMPSTAGYGDIGQTGESSYAGPTSSRHRNNTEHPGREPVGEKHSRAGNKGVNNSNNKKSSSVDDGWFGSSESNQGNKEDVEKHNREMDKRYDHKQGADETVGRGFWSGEFGSGGR